MEYLLLFAVVIFIGFIVVIYNRLVTGRNAVEAAWRQIDVQLKRRHDLIPNLVSSVKDYMQFERETLESVVEARAKAVNANSRGDSIAAEGILEQAMGRLFAVFEAYPDLKAQANVGQLMEELTTTENKISFARQYYNDSVEAQNNRIQVFPNSIVANIFSFSSEEYFSIPDENAHEREVPKVSFS